MKKVIESIGNWENESKEPKIHPSTIRALLKRNGINAGSYYRSNMVRGGYSSPSGDVAVRGYRDGSVSLDVQGHSIRKDDETKKMMMHKVEDILTDAGYTFESNEEFYTIEIQGEQL